MKSHKKIGDDGEIEALVFLKSSWYSIIDTNYIFWKAGEIDIIAQKWEMTVFFEVKKRSWNKYGTAYETLALAKKRKILLTLEHYCLTHRIDFEKIRFDFIAIQDGKITHFENVELY